jgi:tellurium resistance protein TerZ
MALNLFKNTGIKLDKVCVGFNWVAIETIVSVKKGSFFGLGGTTVKNKVKVKVNLHASCVLLDSSKQVLEIIHLGYLNSKTGFVNLTCVNLSGGIDGNDGLDNEIITVNLERLPANVNQIVFFLISNKKQVFADIPFVTIRIYEGTPDRVDKVLETLYVSSLPEFAGKTSAIMGKFYRVNGEWKYNNIGHPTSDTDMNQVLQKILNIYT